MFSKEKYYLHKHLQDNHEKPSQVKYLNKQN